MVEMVNHVQGSAMEAHFEPAGRAEDGSEKQGLYRPAYTPSAMANQDRIIVAQHVEQTNEQASVAPMLDQATRVAGDLETVLFDGNYAKGPVLDEANKRDLDILTKPMSSWKRSEWSWRNQMPDGSWQNAAHG